MRLLITLFCCAFFLEPLEAFVSHSTGGSVLHRRHTVSRPSTRWGKDPKTVEKTALFNPFPRPSDKRRTELTEESFLERVTSYAKRTADSAIEWKDSFKPTGSNRTWLGRFQGYANGIEARLDEINDWILDYSDLRPESEKTLAGQLFLATNLAYAAACIYLAQNGDPLFGFLTELTSIASYAYHYGQLESKGVGNLPSVRLALLIDYILAFTSIGVAIYYLFSAGGDQVLTVLPPAILGLVSLGASWIWVSGLPYMILHGLWHFFSAYTGFLVGTIHSAAL